jgi:hypothetical protein
VPLLIQIFLSYIIGQNYANLFLALQRKIITAIVSLSTSGGASDRYGDSSSRRGVSYGGKNNGIGYGGWGEEYKGRSV